MSFVFAAVGAYLALSGLFLLFPEYWRQIVHSLCGLKPGQLRTVGVLLLSGGGLLMLVGTHAHLLFFALGAYLILEGLLPLFSPHLWRRLAGEILAAPPPLLRRIGVILFGGGALLFWLASFAVAV